MGISALVEYYLIHMENQLKNPAQTATPKTKLASSYLCCPHVTEMSSSTQDMLRSSRSLWLLSITELIYSRLDKPNVQSFYILRCKYNGTAVAKSLMPTAYDNNNDA